MPAAPQLVVRTFGRFEAEIDGASIPWARRRDAQIVTYLALSPHGTASRAELIDVFWNDCDTMLARQSLRTCASNIRRAFAAIVGNERAGEYFRSGAEIVLDLAHAVVDARRFDAFADAGDAARAVRNAREAIENYRSAEWLYAGELLAGEFPAPWHAARAGAYRERYLAVLESLGAVYDEAGRSADARAYRRRASDARARLAAASVRAQTR